MGAIVSTRTQCRPSFVCTDCGDSEQPVPEERLQILYRATLPCTVLHGSSFFHAVMADYTDGSIYEILVVNNSRMTVIPQGKATERVHTAPAG
jgi:hypothetical protein